MTRIEDANLPTVYESSWSTRMWIVQEALLAKQLVLAQDAHLLDWDDFERVMILIHAANAAYRLPIPDGESIIKHTWSLVEVRQYWLTSSHDSDINYYMHQLRR